jgi:hypothetical protein
MPFEERNGLRFFTFSLFPAAEVVHAVFTRQGGFSPSPWDSLNVGGTVGDDPERVRANRRRAFESVGRDPLSMHDVWQVHGADVVVAEAPRPPDAPYQKADVLLTDRPDVTLFMRFADCTPVLLYDPFRRAVGLVHAGWQGTVKGAVRAAVQAMQQRFGSRPQDLRAGIGPAIGPDHYEVGDDVVQSVRKTFGEKSADVLILSQKSGRYHFDLWAANRLWLEAEGVTAIEVAGLCTACHLDDWYSHRAERGKTGRFGALIALQP